MCFLGRLLVQKLSKIIAREFDKRNILCHKGYFYPLKMNG